MSKERRYLDGEELASQQSRKARVESCESSGQKEKAGRGCGGQVQVPDGQRQPARAGSGTNVTRPKDQQSVRSTACKAKM